MKKLLPLLSLFFCLFSYANAQNKNLNKNVEKIKSDTTYYYGESEVLNSLDKASEASINSLYSNIAANIAADAHILYFGSDDPYEYLKNIIKSFENEINDCSFQYPLVENHMKEEYACFTYMKKSDFRRMCDERINEIQRYAANGLRYENTIRQLDEALRSYYWGMMYCIAHPNASKIKINVDDNQQDAYNWFYKRINNILASFEFAVSEANPGELTDDGMYIILDVTSSGNSPISNLQFRYYNGQRYESAKVVDNRATVRLYDNNMSKLDIMIEYDFIKDAMSKPEIRKIIENINKVTFKSNVRRELDLSAYINNLAVYDDDDDDDDDEKTSDVYYGDDYLSIMQEIEKAFRSKNYAKVKRFFDADGVGMLDTLIKYGKMSVIGTQNYEFIDYQNTVICRGIVMNFEFKNHTPFTREVVFRFDRNTDMISSIAFRLSSKTEDDIHSKTMWPLDNRIALVNFLEDYQTAYCLKRYDYLNSIFSDDALIIVGHVVTKNENPMPDRIQFNLPGKQIELIETDKKTYFKKLSNVFKLQEFIDIRFKDADFTRQMSTEDEDSYGVNKKYEDIYGVRLLQEYNSSTYSDEGYLFLLVDLRKENPMIHVRAWQPEKTDINDVIGLKDLR